MGEEGVVRTGERAAAEDNRADGAGGWFVGDVYVTARRILFDGHFRNDGDTHAGADHAEKTAELAAFKNNLGMKARTIAGGDGGVAKAVAIAQQQEGFGAEVFQEERAALGGFAIFGERGEEALGEQRDGFEFVAADGKREDGDVNGARTETVQKDRCDFFHDRQQGLWKFAGERSELRRGGIGGNRGDDAGADGGGGGFLALDDVAFGGFQLAENGAGAG